MRNVRNFPDVSWFYVHLGLFHPVWKFYPMRFPLPGSPRGLFAFALLFTALAMPALRADDAASPVVAQPSANAPVTVTDNGNTWTLDNGIVKAVILKRSGALSSLIYKGVETAGNGQARASGIWEQDPSNAATVG